MLRSLRVMRRVFAHDQDGPRAELPAPGTAPLARPSREAVAVLVIVTGGVLWLLATGYSTGAALGIVGGIGLISAEIAAIITAAQSTVRS